MAKSLQILCLLPLAILLLASCGTEFSSSGIPQTKVSSGRLDLKWIAISPDGQLVQFSFLDRSKKTAGGMGLLDWHAGTLKRIYTRNDWTYSNSIQPGTNNRIVAKPAISGNYGLALIDKDTDKDKEIILKPENGFRTILWPSFVGSNEIIFAAIDPLDPHLKQQASAMGAGQYIDSLVYRLKFGGKPELAFQPINDYMIALKKRLTSAADFPGVTNVVASENGKKIAFIGRSDSEPTDAHGRYNYEIFVLENGHLTQMTHLKTHMSMLAISKDGSTIAFGADDTRTQTFDLWVLDLKTNSLHQMFLAKRFETLAEFNQ